MHAYQLDESLPQIHRLEGAGAIDMLTALPLRVKVSPSTSSLPITQLDSELVGTHRLITDGVFLPHSYNPRARHIRRTQGSGCQILYRDRLARIPNSS